MTVFAIKPLAITVLPGFNHGFTESAAKVFFFYLHLEKWNNQIAENVAPGSKADKKTALDAAAWMFNVVTSVGIIMVNKALMSTQGFVFGTILAVFGMIWYGIASSKPGAKERRNYPLPTVKSQSMDCSQNQVVQKV